MQNRVKWTIASFVMGCFLCLCSISVQANDDSSYWNPETEYSAFILDEAMLIDAGEFQDVLNTMIPITEYGDVIFATTETGYSSARENAIGYLRYYADHKSCTVFLIDMGNREIYIYSDGKIRKTLTTDMTDAITDNIYQFASAGEYAECAKRAFEQEYRLLEGGHVAQSMRWISNLILAFIFSTIIMISLVRLTHNAELPNENDMLSKDRKQRIRNTRKKLIRVDKSRHSDGGSGGGSSGGGGGSSGGGSGHSF